jgi:hypothetical protein
MCQEGESAGSPPLAFSGARLLRWPGFLTSRLEKEFRVGSENLFFDPVSHIEDGTKMPRHIPHALALTFALAASLTPSAANAAPPPNDTFAGKTTIAALPFSDMQSNAEATEEPNEQQPLTGDCGGSTVTGTLWYQFTPVSSMTLQADTTGGLVDTMLTVWTGSQLGGLTEVGCSDQGLAAGQSRVIFSAEAGTPYLFQVGGWEGDTGQIRFNLSSVPALGSISGTIKGPEGTGLANVCAYAIDRVTFDFSGFAVSGSDGRYRIVGLTGGSYAVLFADRCDGSVDHIEEWYQDSPSYSGSTAVTVTAPAERAGVDATLELGGFIEGLILDAATRSPLKEICVQAVDPATEFFAFDVTDETGRYRLGGLRTSSYRVGFFHCPREPEEFEQGPTYGFEWFENKESYEKADPVPVKAPAGVTVDAQLLPKTGRVSKVISLSAKPRKVDSGRRTTLTAIVSPCGGRGGDVVEFFRGKRKLAAAITEPSCTARLRVKMRRTAFFQAVSPGDADILGGSSNLVRVRVRR